MHGIAGELKVYPWCDSSEVLTGIKTVFLDGEGKKSLSASFRTHNNMALCKIEGYATPEQSRALINAVLFAAREDIPVEEGAYFIADLIGLKAVEWETGRELGTLCDVTCAGASDIYHIKRPDGETRLVPAVKEFVKEIDMQNKTISIKLIKGLLDDEV